MGFLKRVTGFLALTCAFAQAVELIEPSELAAEFKTTAHPLILSVAFPILYHQRHIAGAINAGPGSKPEGLVALRAAVAKLPKDAAIFIYCGCCPISKCPNIRPAYEALKAAGFTHVRVLNLPTNFHSDWVEKSYPVEPAVPAL